MFAEPVKEIEKLRDKGEVGGLVTGASDIPLSGEEGYTDIVEKGLFDAIATVDVGDAKSIEFTVRGAKIVYDVAAKTIACGRHKAPLSLKDGELTLRVLVDRGSVELFSGEGAVAISTAHRPAADDVVITMFAKGGKAKIESADVFQLKSSWQSLNAQSTDTPAKN